MLEHQAGRTFGINQYSGHVDALGAQLVENQVAPRIGSNSPDPSRPVPKSSYANGEVGLSSADPERRS
jgi:hypothetical protein